MTERLRKPWGEAPPPDPHVWNTLGYRGIEQADGGCVIEWDATPAYCFHAPSGPIVHGGMVAALLDTVMAYLEQGNSLEATARLLFVHPNTVRYRLRRVTELTGVTPGDGRGGFALWTAVVLGRLAHKRA